MTEAVIATALIAVAAGTVLAAVCATQHALTAARPAAALALSAQNILTDLRAASAYDGLQIAGLAGRSVTFDAREPAADGGTRIVHAVVTIAPAAAGELNASVTVSNAQGQSATVRSALVQEAPAPGSVVDAPPLEATGTATPQPDSISPTESAGSASGDAGPISL